MEGSLGWSAVKLEGFDGRSAPTIIGVLPKRGCYSPTAHGGPKANFTLISPEVKVLSSTIGSQWNVSRRQRLDSPLGGGYPGFGFLIR